jgi:streptogramin lyase
MKDTGRRARPYLVAVAILALAAIGVLVFREATRKPAGASDPQYRYSLGALGQPPAELPRYRRSGEIPLELQDPRGVAALAGGRLAVCGDRSLVLLGSDGAALERFALEAGPTCVAADGKGRLYVGFADHLEVIDPADGSRRRWPDLGGEAIVTSIAAGPEEVFVADAGNGMVLRFDRSGRLTGTITGGFLVPSPYFDLAAAPDGTLWVVNPGRHRLQHYDRQGAPLGAWGRGSLDIDGFGGCCNPTHIALLPDGSFVTSEKGIPRVKTYRPDGRLAALVAIPRDFSQYESGLDLAVMADGTIVLLVPREKRLRLYRPGAAGGSS